MILETTFIIDILKGRKDAIDKLNLMVEDNEPIEITSPSIFELWTGAVALQRGDYEKERIRKIIDGQKIYSLDKSSAEIAGKINGELIKKGMQIDPEDCMIAGISIINDKTLLTRDNHFERIEGLKIEKY